MKYLLTVLTNGRSQYLERALASFEEFVVPRPSGCFIHVDGPHGLPPALHGEIRWDAQIAPDPLGFTGGTKACLDYAARSDYDWFFHLEDDFVILRPVDLRPLASVLEKQPSLKQLALLRCPWGAEIEYGSYVMQHPGSYERLGVWNEQWMKTTRNFSTNPALASTSFPREHPYPEVQHSEGMYGFQIREREPDAFFGLWGWGEPWCAHIGVDRAAGSHGY
jgi:hypothetical protein